MSTGTHIGRSNVFSTQRTKQRSIAGAPTAEANCKSYASTSTDAWRESFASSTNAPSGGNEGLGSIKRDGRRTQWPTCRCSHALSCVCSRFAASARWEATAACRALGPSLTGSHPPHRISSFRTLVWPPDAAAKRAPLGARAAGRRASDGSRLSSMLTAFALPALHATLNLASSSSAFGFALRNLYPSVNWRKRSTARSRLYSSATWLGVTGSEPSAATTSCLD